MNKKNNRPKKYKVEDFVRISIPKIDCSGIDHPILPCKIKNITENNQYLLGLKFRIINSYYSPWEIEPLGTIREAAHLQSAGPVTDASCNLKWMQ